MASQVLITISKEEKEQAWLRSREKYVLDTQSEITYARQEGEARGMKKGKAEGHNEKAFEIACKMKNAGRPFSEITEFTGLTPEAIQKL